MPSRPAATVATGPAPRTGISDRPGIAQAPIDEVVVTNTIPLTDEAKKISKIKVLSVAGMLGEAIKRIHRDESVSSLFAQDIS